MKLKLSTITPRRKGKLDVHCLTQHNQHQSNIPHAPIAVIPTPVWAAQTLGKSTTIAMALVISLPCAGGPILSDVQMTALTGHRETSEAGLTGPVATGAQANHPAEAGNLAEALATVPTEASGPAKAPPLTTAKEAREDHHTMAKETPSYTGIK